MKFGKNFPPSLAGSLIAAHPGLIDPNYSKAVVLISVHNPSTGSIGIVINTPTGLTISDFDPHYEHTPLGNIPLYYGGPVGKDQVILTAWQWKESEGTFKLYFGIPEDTALKLKNALPQIELRAYLGYSGWDNGQLEVEIKRHTWLLSSVKNLTHDLTDSQIWRNVISHTNPELLFLVDIPKDPTKN